jgi:hypothetical protein
MKEDTKIVRKFIDEAVKNISTEFLGCKKKESPEWKQPDLIYSYRIDETRIVKIIVELTDLSHIIINGYDYGRRVDLHSDRARKEILVSFKQIIKAATNEDIEVVFRPTGMRARTRKYKK